MAADAILSANHLRESLTPAGTHEDDAGQGITSKDRPV